MALTVRTLATQADLGLRLLAGAGAAQDPITWVHVSELDDPTPFLSGGELLLTTGLFVRPGTDVPAYVDRLAAAGVLGLGFGIGLSCAQVPAELVAAADRIGLPVLEVPRRTPFIALSRAVSRALAADEYAAVTRTFTAQQELARAAVSPDSPARLIRLLARKVDGWVVLLDGRGEVLALGGDGAAATAPAVAVEAARLREHRGSVGASIEIDRDGRPDRVSLQPIGAGPVRRGFLAVGHAGPLAAAERHLVNAAVMLLTLGLEQDPAPRATGAVRAAAVELALAGRPDVARSLAARAGATWPADPLVVLLARPHPDHPRSHPDPSRADQQRRRGSTHAEWDGWDASQRVQPRGAGVPGPTGPGAGSAAGSGLPVGPAAGVAHLGDGPAWSADLDGELVVIVPAPAEPARVADLAREVVRAVAPDAAGSPHRQSSAGTARHDPAGHDPAGHDTAGHDPAGWTVGWSAPTTVAGLPAAREQARRAATAASGRGLAILGFEDIGAAGIAAMWDPEQAAAFAASLLAPLVEHDRAGRGDLVASLRAWLAHHGQWDPAAVALGVHRHTLRRRMTLVAELLGRDLDSPTVRSELWLALETGDAPIAGSG